MSLESEFSWSDFNTLDHAVVKLLSKQGFKHPTPIQAELLTAYRNHQDFLIASQTGSGKTIAFAAPIISHLRSLIEKNNV